MTKSCAVSMGMWTPIHCVGLEESDVLCRVGRGVVGRSVGGGGAGPVELGDGRLGEVDRVDGGPRLERDGRLVGRGEDDGEQHDEHGDGEEGDERLLQDVVGDVGALPFLDVAVGLEAAAALGGSGLMRRPRCRGGVDSVLCRVTVVVGFGERRDDAAPPHQEDVQSRDGDDRRWAAARCATSASARNSARSRRRRHRWR